MPSIICPKQSTPPVDAPPNGDPVESARRRNALFGKTWFLFFNSVTDAINAIQARLVVLLDAVLGFSGLTTEGAIPKVSATPGKLEESALLDDGTDILSTQPLAIDTGATPSTQIRLQANALGMLALLSFAADNQNVLLDCDYDGTDFFAKDTSAANVRKNGDLVKIEWATGLTVGNTFTFDGTSIAIDLATGLVGFGGNTAPAYEVDVDGDVNVTGAFKVNGTDISGGVTAQNVVTGSRALGTTYQNTGTTPMMVTVTLSCVASGGANFGQANILTDASSPPTTVVANTFNGSTTNTIHSQISFWVLPGNYYRINVVTTTVTLQVWTEWT